MILWGFIFIFISIIALRLIERALGKTEIEEEIEEKDWITDPSYSLISGNIFHDHTMYEHSTYEHNMKD